VAYTTANGTAFAGSDYAATNGVLTFVPGVTNQLLVVPVTGDIGVESNEVFYVKLTNAANGLLVRTQAVCTILDDDRLPGKVNHFVWAPITPLQRSGTPFAVTITALDVSNVVAGGFSEPVRLRLKPPQTGNMLGGLTSDYGFSDTRTVGYAFTPDKDLTVVAVRHCSGTKVTVWADDSMQTVFSQPVVSTNGIWVETLLSSPVTLSGGRTYRVGVYTGGGYCYYADSGITSFPDGVLLHGCEGYGDGYPYFDDGIRWWLVDLSYQVGPAGPTNLVVAPTNTSSFTNGVWSGLVSLTGSGTNVVLQAVDAVGHSGTSAAFDLLPAGGCQFDSSGSCLLFTNGGFKLRLLGCTGRGSLVIYASTNLVYWEPVFTNPPVIGTLEFIDLDAHRYSKRFYRATEGAVAVVHLLRFDNSPGSLAITNSAFRLRVLGASGLPSVVIYASTNLQSWTPIFTNSALTDRFEYLDSAAASFRQRYYRLRSP